MPEMSFDDQMQSAWIDYGLELSARLSAMRPGDVVTIAQPIDEVSESPHGQVTFTLTGVGASAPPSTTPACPYPATRLKMRCDNSPTVVGDA
ncbi:hypothetical protein [Gordonia rhizosphera]|uniref:Uncharacterized protein n=1 Tax=Gordonia rhizosphera NBRC 16068 TaxID=1108045 RepID=K6V3S4_9ACTN|nr:hypothetical protein [Gordonia rhizosphera]GAB90753.1 hypothetical protein GORHZ_117_00160 [Gordonia rhizosphera NBRC 16068]